jgi:hypothetical protein
MTKAVCKRALRKYFTRHNLKLIITAILHVRAAKSKPRDGKVTIVVFIDEMRELEIERVTRLYAR